MYPEQVVRRLAKARGIKVFAHEVSFQPLAGFFTPGEATAYLIDIPDEFDLNDQQNKILDDYLAARFQGNFSMAGIQFWPEMHHLDAELQQKIDSFKQLVPVFTNVIFDTSQPHANTVFEHMFAWLDLVLELIKAHPETLFVIRAHPDELRPGTRKQARESVRSWVQHNQAANLPNVVFIDSQEYVSSYDLIHQAKYILVYNSSIALEATLLGKAVLCGGRARFMPYPAVFFPQSVETYREMAEEFLAAETIEIPEEFPRNARRFLYYQNWRTPLPFSDYLQPHSLKGYVRFRSFSVEQLKPDNSPSLKVVRDGIMRGQPFLMPDEFEDQ
jgi:hypothetical protein